MAVLAHHTVLPPAPDQYGDRDELAVLAELLAGGTRVTVSCSGGSVELPLGVRVLLRDAVGALVDGRAVTVEPHRTVLTTQEAAELLGITRPTFVRLLESGRIPFTTPGRHRRVELAAVLAFQEGERKRRRGVLDEMAREATPEPPSAADGFAETR